AEIYRWRWQIELFFRHFKQTFGRAKLRSHKAEHAECEVHWSLLGIWAMLLHAHVEHQRANATPRRLSVARVLNAFGQAIDESQCSPKQDKSFTGRILPAVIDQYCRRNKRSEERRVGKRRRDR